MRRLTLAAGLALVALPAFAQNVVVVPAAPGGVVPVAPGAVVVAPPANSGFDPNSPEPGAKAIVAGQARDAGLGTPQVAPNGSAYVPSNRGVDPAAGYSREPAPIVAVPVTR